MKGVASASVSAGSSQREAIVTCNPQVTVPSGAATVGDGVTDARAMRARAQTSRDIEISFRGAMITGTPSRTPRLRIGEPRNAQDLLTYRSPFSRPPKPPG